MEGPPMVSYLTGVMNSLVDRLTKLKVHHPKLKDLREDLENLKKDPLDKFAGRGAKDEQVKVWIKQVRELVYDIDDWIEPEPPTNLGESEIKQIEEFKAQIQDARERCTRYDLPKKVPTSDADLSDVGRSKVPIDESRLLWEEKTVLVAVDVAKKELEKHLMNEEKKLKVVCVVGMDGYGKTSIAKEIYGKLGRQFDCQAFVSVGRRPSMKSTLLDILRQVNPQDEREYRDVQPVIAELWKFLGTKRYFILIDDLRSTWAWKVINSALPISQKKDSALPDKNPGSRVLTTTCIMDVAKSCSIHPSDVIYRVEALSENDSRSLFRSRISIREEEEERPAGFKEVSDDMLKMCGGMPLAIIVTAGLLTRKSAELGPSKRLEKYTLSASDQYSTSQGMRNILDMSYADLSLPVKSCFLYVSVFPENYTIKKDRLIRVWVAEGFIPKRDEETSWETGESYFNELISRRLIQPVFDDDDGQAVGCTVHGVILDFIASLSSEENFVTAGAELRSGPFPCDTIRRFSLDCSNQEEEDTLVDCSNQEEDDTFASSTVHISKVRSLTFFGDVNRMPAKTLHCLRFLRVLDLEDTENLGNCHLEGIGRLVLLRYLGLGGTDIEVLPEEIGKLQNLETLDLRRTTRLRTLPASIVGLLPKLVRLLLDIRVKLPREIWKVEELEELSTINVDISSSLDSVTELLIKSKRLRMLGVLWDWDVHYGDRETTETNLRSFLEEVGKSNLQSLLLEGYREDVLLDILLDSWVPPHHLRRFELTIYGPLRGVPPKMASLVNLTHLRISIYEAEAEGLRVLGDLPKLILLKLEYRGFDSERRLITSMMGLQFTPSEDTSSFRCLLVFSYKCAGMGLQFTPGAMPQLRRLRIEFSAMETVRRYGDFDFGIQHLSCLTRVHAAIHCQDARKSLEGAEAAITEQVSKNPNSPVLELSREIIVSGRMARQEEHETVQESYEQESRISDKDSDEEHATLQKQQEIMELDVDSNTNKQADSRVSTLLSESSSHLVNPDEDSREVEKKQADSRISTLSESSSRLPVGGADPESVSTAAVINHPSDPKINPQSVDWILCGDEDIKKVGSKPAIMTEDAMVSAFTGAMNSLLVKLATLLGEQYAKLTAGTRKEFMILKDELDAMKTLLEQLAGMAELSAQMRDSRNQMREMTYDIEDCIDDLMVQLSRGVTTLSNDLIIMLQNFTDQIKAQLEEADLRSMVPRTEMRSFGPSYMSREQWLSLDEGNGLVGMDGPRDELVRRLSGDEQDKLQGVCILGVAGIGKTMLATQVYNEIKRRFDRCVFISASKKVDMARLCRSILLQLQLHEPINSSNRRNDVHYLIDRVRTNLRDKRFLIVIDGVWSAHIVEDIKVALPEKNRGSRIITTSGISDVAESCGKHFSSFTYPMEPLTFEESLGLFRSIIFGSGRSCPVASEKVDEEIVKACGGIPLALRLIAGALASKPAEMEQWVTFREKIKKQAGTGDHLNVEWMRKIFDISYSDLSCDMKTCLLYLSAFPENHVIRKDRLISRWVAEGFLQKRCGKTWWETGESYFLELVARNLVKPVYDEEDVLPIAQNLVKPVYDEEDVLPIGCKVSGSVHDFITSLSSEENFVKSDVTDPTCMQHGVFRRLSVDLGSDNQEKPLDLFQGALSSKVRSLTFVEGFGFGWMSDLSAFKHVRVLDLKDNKRLENEQLESIGRLSLLRYLGLGGTSVTELPRQIMALEQLTTLDIRRTGVRKLPAFRDTKLVFLLADELKIPRGMGEMQKLEELSKVLIGPDGSYADDVAGLVNKLRRLRMLGVRFSRLYAQNETHQQEVKHFVEEVGKSNLQSLFLDNYPHHLLDLLVDSWAHKRPHHLREIELRIPGCLQLVPKEMASLIALTHLHINVEVVRAQCVRALGNLPNLVLLKLCSDTSPRLAVSSKDGFQCLKVFCYWSGGGMGLQFEAGAMPQLRRLVLDFNVRETISKYGDFDFGVQHLSYLVQVRATMRDCRSATASEVEAAEAKMRDQVSQNPNHPVLEWKTRQCSTAPAEGSVIAIHGLDEWFIETEEANLTNKLVVIFFTESSCVPSVEMVPVLADLAKKLPNVVFLKVDLDVAETMHIVEQFGVDGSPTFLFMKGGLVKDTIRGANTKELAWKLEVWE